MFKAEASHRDCGLDFFPSSQIDKARGKQRQQQIQEEIQAYV